MSPPHEDADEVVLTFATTYRVLTADRHLAEAGVPHGLTPTPAGLTSPCGLSLRLPGAARAAALAVLAGGPAVDGWYRRRGADWVSLAPPT